MISKSDRDQAISFIHDYSLGVIATINESCNPATSAIFYTTNKSGDISFFTKDKTQ